MVIKPNSGCALKAESTRMLSKTISIMMAC
jgi:hypothetical protein